MAKADTFQKFIIAVKNLVTRRKGKQPVTKNIIEKLVKAARNVPHSQIEYRAADLKTKYVGISETGVVVTHTIPETTEHIDFWEQNIQLMDFSVFIEGEYNASVAQLRRDILDRLNGDMELNIGCNCPAYKYWGYHYINTKYKAALGSQEMRYPKERNPKLEGFVCKHLYQALLMLPLLATFIAKDLSTAKYIQKFKPATKKQIVR